MLESPTSVSMKNSFIIKNNDPNFDHYSNQMKKGKRHGGQGLGTGNIFGLNFGEASGNMSRQGGKRPPARDGHTSVLYNGLYFIFGGDRHHMPFNDLFALDIDAEFESKRDAFF